MTTTIAPASGAGALFTQQGVGTTPGYSALDDRRSNSGALQEGVYGTPTLVTAGGVSNVGSADFMVTQRGAGANMSVDVNMPAGGFAFVQGDTINGQGLYCVPVHSANINEAIAAADATNPRVDQLILEVQDNVLDASGGNLARTRVLTGTPSGTATLTTRAGAAALPGSALLLADVLVPASSASVPNSNIRDRRKWARGAFIILSKTNANATTTNTASYVDIDTARLQARVECSGVPVRFKLNAIGNHSVANVAVVTGLDIDGTFTQGLGEASSPGASVSEFAGYIYETIPVAGSHLFNPAFLSSSAGTATLLGSVSAPLLFTIEEIVRSNAANSNGVTTG